MNEITHKNEGLEDKPPTPIEWELKEYREGEREIKENTTIQKRPPFVILRKENLFVSEDIVVKRETNRKKGFSYGE